MTHPIQVVRAREQRQRLGEGERDLWYNLRGRRLLGYKFRRQLPVGPFIADFACVSARLIIETDGESHGCDDQAEHDTRRTAWLEQEGWRVIRFWSHELSDMENVRERILLALEPSP